MEILSLLLVFASILLLLVGVILLIVKAVKHKKKAPAVLMIVLALVLFVASVLVMPAGEVAEGGDAYSDTELFAAEFCMAYMNNLKNPYSFTLKSAWAMDNGDGTYQVFVKFTAENVFGAETAEQIGSMGSLSKADLQKIAQGGDNVSILTWGSEPSGMVTGGGQNLDAAKIQEYINSNY